MAVRQSQYETLLAEYSNHLAAIALLRRHRPYLEMLPSLRRPQESLITLPLPIVRVRIPHASGSSSSHLGRSSAELRRLPCDIAILMCDPEWKVKTGIEVCVFIHRPDEDFSDLLGRWRQTQVWLDGDYEWILPPRHDHLTNDGTENVYPLFVVFEESPERIKRGLRGALLPFVMHESPEEPEPALTDSESSADWHPEDLAG